MKNDEFSLQLKPTDRGDWSNWCIPNPALEVTLEPAYQVLREPRSSGDVDAVLEEYAQHISANLPPAHGGARGRTGSILMCVVGGKLSEGINFSDGLGRCVIVAGLPFPNSADPSLQVPLSQNS